MGRRGGSTASEASERLVTWANHINTAQVGNNLTKNAGGAGWNAGAQSNVDTVASGDCYIEVTVNTQTATTQNYIFGLSADANDGTRDTIDFALQVVETNALGDVYVRTNNTFPGGGTPEINNLADGDKLRVEVSGADVLFKRFTAGSWSTFRTLTAPTIAYPLKATASIYDTTAVVKDATMFR